MTAITKRRRSSSRGVAVVTAVYALVMLGGTLPVPLYAFWAPQFGFGPFTTTLIFAVYALGTVTALLFFASLSDQAGRRPLLLTALAAAVASTVLFLTAHNVVMLLAARFVFGLTTGVFTATATAALGEFSGRPGSHQASILASAANAGGLGLGAVLAGVLAQTTADPTHLIFWIYLAILLMALVVTATIPEPVDRPQRPTLSIRRPSLPADPGDRPSFFRVASAVFAAFAVAGLFSSLVPAFLQNDLHVTNHAAIGGEVALFFAAALVTQVTARDRMLSSTVLAPLTLAAGVVAFQTGLLSRSLGVFVAGTVVAGAAFGLILRRGVGVTHELADPSRRADLLATFFLFAYAGNIVPTVALGGLEQVLSSDIATSALAAVVLVLTLAAALPRHPHPGHPPARRRTPERIP